MELAPVEIPSNGFWGKRFGAEYTPQDKKKSDGSWGWHFPKAGYGSPSSTSGKTVNKPETAQAKKDKQKFIDNGRPVIYVTKGNKRVRREGK